MSYSPKIFDVNSMDEARQIILTRSGRTTDIRWQTETPYLMELIMTSFRLGPDSVVLDYGCGVGRLSKALIDRFACRVVGVDISPSMRMLASVYVDSDLFSVHASRDLIDSPKFDLALAVWVLQHCDAVENDIAIIASRLKPNGRLFLLNARQRFVPEDSPRKWFDDGKDVAALVAERFVKTDDLYLDPVWVGEHTAERSYCSTWIKK